MSLMECLVYVVVLFMLVNLSVAIFTSGSRLSQVGTNATDRLRAVEEFRLGVVRTVREAEAVAPALGPFTTGPSQLVLKMAPLPEQGNAARFVVLANIASPTRLSRLVMLEKDGALTQESCSTYALDVAALRFSFGEEAPAKARLVSLVVTPREPHAVKRKYPDTFHIAAALRGWSGL